MNELFSHGIAQRIHHSSCTLFLHSVIGIGKASLKRPKQDAPSHLRPRLIVRRLVLKTVDINLLLFPEMQIRRVGKSSKSIQLQGKITCENDSLRLRLL